MRNYLAKILMNKAGEGDAGGESNPPATPATPPANDPPSEGDGDNLDELGYEKPKAGEPPKAGDKPPQAPAKKPEKVENPVTGYGAEPPKIEDLPPPVDPSKKVDPPPAPTDLDKKLEGLHPEQARELKAHAAELGLEGEKLDKFIVIERQKLVNATNWVAQQQAEEVRQNQIRDAGWHKELKEDPVFGGDKFLTNVTRGEKVLDEYLPELKKELTKAKAMLRPSVMRGLARLADQLYPEDKVVHGDPPAPEGEKPGDNEKNDPLAFYE